MKIFRITFLAAIMALAMSASAGATTSPELINYSGFTSATLTSRPSGSLTSRISYEVDSDNRLGISTSGGNPSSYAYWDGSSMSSRNAHLIQAVQISSAWPGHFATGGEVKLTFDYMNVGLSASNSYVRIYGFGTTADTAPTGSNYASSGALLGTYTFSSSSHTSWTGASLTLNPAAGYKWYIVDIYGYINSGNSGNNYLSIDNVSLKVTPIPPAAWLLGTGLLGLIGLRRRFKK